MNPSTHGWLAGLKNNTVLKAIFWIYFNFSRQTNINNDRNTKVKRILHIKGKEKKEQLNKN